MLSGTTGSCSGWPDCGLHPEWSRNSLMSYTLSSYENEDNHAKSYSSEYF